MTDVFPLETNSYSEHINITLAESEKAGLFFLIEAALRDVVSAGTDWMSSYIGHQNAKVLADTLALTYQGYSPCDELAPEFTDFISEPGEWANNFYKNTFQVQEAMLSRLEDARRKRGWPCSRVSNVKHVFFPRDHESYEYELFACVLGLVSDLALIDIDDKTLLDWVRSATGEFDGDDVQDCVFNKTMDKFCDVADAVSH